jgi:hypothetical protein
MVMPLTSDDLLQHAARAEASAQSIDDPIVKRAYLDLAAALREMAMATSDLASLSDEDVEHLAQRMVGGRKSTL